MNQKRLALSAFLVGAIIAPLALRSRGDWTRLADRITWNTEDFWERNHPPAPHSEPPPYPPIVYGPPPVETTDYLDTIHPGQGWDGSVEPPPPFVTAAARLLPWLLAAILGGISAAILGYLMPTFYAVAFRGVPSLLRFYVRWLNGPGA